MIFNVSEKTIDRTEFVKLSEHVLKAINEYLRERANFAEASSKSGNSSSRDALFANISTTRIYSHAVDRINSICKNVINDAIF